MRLEPNGEENRFSMLTNDNLKITEDFFDHDIFVPNS